MSASEEAAARERILSWKADLRRFVREVLGATPDAWQDEALQLVQENDKVALIASKGPGKSCVKAWVAHWYMLTRPQAQGICTSITRENLRDGLWKEIAYWYGKSPLLQRVFGLTTERLFARESPLDWWLSARGWRKGADEQQQAAALAGLHADHVLYLGDEAGDYPRGVIAAAEGIHANAVPGSGREAKTVLGGNPTNPNGPLHDCDTNRRVWRVVHINGDPENPKRSPRVSIEWAQELIRRYGRAHPWVKVNVLGEFPEAAFNALLSVDEVRAAMERTVTEDAFAWAQRRLGVDVARFGDDRTVIFPRQGLMAFVPAVMRHARDSNPSVDVANRVMAAKQKWRSEVEILDATGGWAAGTRDVLRAAGHRPLCVQFHAPDVEPEYYNQRAGMWWRMAEWVKSGGCLPKSVEELVDELTAPTYSYQRGKIMIEPKEIVKERIGRSPDLADALGLTFAIPDMPARAGRPRAQEAKREWDPYAEDHL